MRPAGCHVVAGGLVLLLLSACATRSDPVEVRVRDAVWLVEDLAAGLPRDPDELDPMGQAGWTRLVDWLRGDELLGGGRRLPALLRGRAARRPLLDAALAAGQLSPVEETGLLEADPALEGEVLRRCAALTEAENAERGILDGVLPRMIGLAPPAAAAWRAESARVRAARDREAGRGTPPPAFPAAAGILDPG